VFITGARRTGRRFCQRLSLVVLTRTGAANNTTSEIEPVGTATCNGDRPTVAADAVLGCRRSSRPITRKTRLICYVLPWWLPAAILAWPTAAGATGWVDEGKLGVIYHDIPVGGDHREPQADVNGELLFASPDFLEAIGAPRPHLGGSVNTAGATSYAYFGLTWTATPCDGPIFLGLGLGGAVHDGLLNKEIPHRKELGSRVLFHESLESGYRFTESVSLSIFFDHMSDANLTRHNAGMTNLGLRIGFKF
jgi:lipid A 3-O-deacylase